jgi:lysophospholipid hydrolase
MESVIQNNVDLFLRPPVSHFATLDFDKFDEIERVGYEYSKPLIEEWAKENCFGKYRT